MIRCQHITEHQIGLRWRRCRSEAVIHFALDVSGTRVPWNVCMEHARTTRMEAKARDAYFSIVSEAAIQAAGAVVGTVAGQASQLPCK